MKVIKLSNTHQIITCEDCFLIGDFNAPRYITLQKNAENTLILELFSKALYTFNEILSIAKERNLDTEKIKKVINAFIRIGVLENCEFPDTAYIEDYRYHKIPEMQFNKRFGQEISWLKRFETKDLNRFDLFKKISELHITIIGAGGLGSYLTVLLAAIGVRNIKIVDADTVDVSNLTRQVFYTVEQDQNNTPKVYALKEFINKFNPSVNLTCINKYLNDYDTANEIIDSSIDIVIQTADKPKGILERSIAEACINKKVSCLFTHGGNIGPFYIPNISSSCYFCFEDILNKESDNLYELYVNNFDNSLETTTDSFAIGPLRLSYYILLEIICFVSDKKTVKTRDKLMQLGNGFDKISFLEIPHVCGCKCEGVNKYEKNKIHGNI